VRLVARQTVRGGHRLDVTICRAAETAFCRRPDRSIRIALKIEQMRFAKAVAACQDLTNASLAKVRELSFRRGDPDSAHRIRDQTGAQAAAELQPRDALHDVSVDYMEYALLPRAHPCAATRVSSHCKHVSETRCGNCDELAVFERRQPADSRDPYSHVPILGQRFDRIVGSRGR